MENNEEIDNFDKSKKSAKHDERGAADLEKVTDYFEEQELNVDINAIEAMSGTAADPSADNKAKQEKRLQKIKVNAEDIELICKEMEVSKTVAELCLKENQGDIYKTLVEMIR